MMPIEFAIRRDNERSRNTTARREHRRQQLAQVTIGVERRVGIEAGVQRKLAFKEKDDDLPTARERDPIGTRRVERVGGLRLPGGENRKPDPILSQNVERFQIDGRLRRPKSERTPPEARFVIRNPPI